MGHRERRIAAKIGNMRKKLAMQSKYIPLFTRKKEADKARNRQIRQSGPVSGKQMSQSRPVSVLGLGQFSGKRL